MRVFDGHCDTILHCYETGDHLGDSSGHLSLDKLGAFSNYAQFFAIFDDQSAHPGQSLFPVFQAQRDLFRRELEANPQRVALCTRGNHLDRAWAQGQVAAFLSVEGAELLECDPDRLHTAFQLGVRAVNITWNNPNPLSGTNLMEPERGLSPRGRDFVREMNALGMLVDVSHISDPGFWDVVEVTSAPIFASHSDSRHIHFHSRNLTDDQFTAIIDLQGVVGLNLCADFLGPDPTLDTVVRHLEHFLDLGGEDTVALGGDWDGISRMPSEVHDVTGWALLHRRLEELGYSGELLDKLFYQNLTRVVKKVCIM